MVCPAACEPQSTLGVALCGAVGNAEDAGLSPHECAVLIQPDRLALGLRLCASTGIRHSRQVSFVASDGFGAMAAKTNLWCRILRCSDAFGTGHSTWPFPSEAGVTVTGDNGNNLCNRFGGSIWKISRVTYWLRVL